MAITNDAPKNLKELYKKVIDTASEFGYKKNENGIFRDCITENGGEIRTPANSESNFWFGFIREDQPAGGAYEGLSYVIFPEHAGSHCLVSIGIGSGSIGKDGDLAASPGFRRSFMKLVKKEEKCNAKFFFKLRFDEMETSTPGLQEELSSSSYEDVMVNTTTKYNADEDKDAPGLLPAAFIVDYTKESGWKLIQAWLAQYARWRSWEKYKKGTAKTTAATKIATAIKACRAEAECPTSEEVQYILGKHKYVVLQGAPGCGKTWTANEISDKYDEVEFIQFHAETTYADFVYGIRPVLNGTKVAYKGEKGALLRAIDKANSNTDKQVLLIIDEINRANLANVLGPVFYLFEPNTERKHKLELGKIYDENNEEKIISYEKLPDNLHVLATMNTADKSLAVVDFALRRRFAWVTLRPHKLDTTKFDEKFFDKVDELFMKYATDEELNLQPGQSYFMDSDLRKEKIEYGLMPLMKEYFAEGFLLSAKEEFAQLFFTETGKYMFE